MTTGRRAWVEAVVAALDAERDLVVASLGANARYLGHLGPPVPHLDLCDSMGAAIPIGLGMALARPDRRVLVLEGDGALLMNLGTLATVAAARPANLVAMVFDNGRYESSGGQALPDVGVDFVAVAGGLGLAAERVAEAPALSAALGRARSGRGPVLLVLPTVFDPAESIPPYAARPAEVRLNFDRVLRGS